MENASVLCQHCHQWFTIEPDDVAFYEQIHVPPPTWCPQCRMLRRFAWQGYRILYKRKCDATGDMLISAHHPDSPHTVYRQDVWWSDSWDPLAYGRDIDWSRPFLEQYRELLRDVPLPALMTEYTSMVNSEYCNAASECKNSYLCFRVSGAQDSAYLNLVSKIKDSFDCSYFKDTELSYDSVLLKACSRTFYSKDCAHCHDIWFSYDLHGCSDCVGCASMRHKSYCIFNQQYNREEYQALFDKYDFGSHRFVEEFQKNAEAFMLTRLRQNFSERLVTNTSGDIIYNSKNVRDSYYVLKSENMRYCQFVKKGPAANCYDYSLFGEGAEWIYESTWVGLQSNNIKFSVWNYHASDLEFCFGCHGSNSLFGCVGVRKGEYCILNKRYTKKEYLELTERLRQHMMDRPYVDPQGRQYQYGQMLPSEFCPWTYNESLAYEWFPLTKDEALGQGFTWRDEDPRHYREATVAIPDHIKDAADDILDAILKCDQCGRNYQIIAKELQFLGRFKLPIPRQCPLCRDRARTARLNPIAIFDRMCAQCGTAIKTSYSPDRPEIVYCGECYQREVA